MSDAANRSRDAQVAWDYAFIHAQVYLKATAPVREVIDSMSKIVANPGLTDNEREMALSTLEEALFAFGKPNGPG
jgi:hypothetical protein